MNDVESGQYQVALNLDKGIMILGPDSLQVYQDHAKIKIQDVFITEYDDKGRGRSKVEVHPSRFFTYNFDKVYPIQSLQKEIF